ncbi:MAG: FAD-dependent oxidoreductase [Burkholderiales bacterium]
MSDVESHDVIIIGGGPAGLAAATELRRLGLRDVVVMEREQQAGGVPRHCGHRGFGWREFQRLLTGPDYARRLIAATEGIDLRTGTTALALEENGHVKVLTPGGIRELQGRRILLALGTRETPRAARLVSGSRPWGVFTTGALQQLVYLGGSKPCTRAVIIGSELVSFSSLLTLRHAGIQVLAMLEESAHVMAPRPAEWLARTALRTRIMKNARLVCIHGDTHVTGVEIDRNGTREFLNCDGVIFTGKFVPEAALLANSPLAIDAATGGPVIDQYGRCTDPTYFAAGNLLRPVEASWTVWSEGRAVARAIAASLRGQLPIAMRQVKLTTRDPVRYVCPQYISFPAFIAPALPINVRVTQGVRGRLRLLDGKREIWGSTRGLLPERRITLPSIAHPPEHAAEWVIEIDLQDRR